MRTDITYGCVPSTAHKEVNMRAQILKTYRAQIATYLARTYNLTPEKVDKISMEICKSCYKPLTAIIEDNRVDGNPEVKAVDLATFFDSHVEDLMSPSGSIYIQHEKRLAHTIEMILDLKADRSRHKKAQFKAEAEGNDTEKMKHYYAQTLIKIKMNSLPGNYGSAYSVFYDKGNYNAITSAGRTLIAYAYAEIEAVLGGNFAFFSQEELMQHIIAHLTRGIDHEKVRKVMKNHDLKWVTGTDLYNFYVDILKTYNTYENFFMIADIISKMSQEEVQYFWYFQNFRHILMDNEQHFKPWFEDLFNIDKVKMDDTVSPDELFKLDGALVIFCNVAFHKYVDPDDPEIQVYDLPKVRPDLAKKFVCITKYVENKLKDVDDIFDLFIYTPINRTDVYHRKFMRRNSAVISDTDSVIFTVKDWVKWYTGDVYDISDKAYHIACCMIYWIQNAVAHTLYLYSVAHGAKGPYTKTMMMKNEFLYPVMILADVKKHYAGIVTVQEGTILPKASIDIKGVQFKGSDICKEATKFAEKFIEKDNLLDSYKQGRVNGHELIDKVRRFEQKIHDDIKAGSTVWFKSQSIRPKEEYTKPMSSPWFYYLAWSEIFADKYGEIVVPSKTPCINVMKPTKEYFDWLKTKSPKIAEKFSNFIVKYGRSPTSFLVNPVGNKVPEELIPLIKIHEIIYHNVRPCHLILKQIGISCGYDKDRLLFSDVYPPPKKDKE